MANRRPARSDAVRNRAHIIAAATSLIASRGVEVGMDEIAGAAGVAVGTLYRHFPTKADLVAAAVEQYVDSAAEDAESSRCRAERGESRAVDEVVAYLHRVGDSSADHFAMKAAARSLGVGRDSDTSAEHRIGAALDGLLRLGQAAGEIRQNVTVDDLFLLMTTMPTDRPAPIRRRWIGLVLPGITSEGLPGTSPKK